MTDSHNSLTVPTPNRPLLGPTAKTIGYLLPLAIFLGFIWTTIAASSYYATFGLSTRDVGVTVDSLASAAAPYILICTFAVATSFWTGLKLDRSLGEIRYLRHRRFLARTIKDAANTFDQTSRRFRKAGVWANALRHSAQILDEVAEDLEKINAGHRLWTVHRHAARSLPDIAETLEAAQASLDIKTDALVLADIALTHALRMARTKKEFADAKFALKTLSKTRRIQKDAVRALKKSSRTLVKIRSTLAEFDTLQNRPEGESRTKQIHVSTVIGIGFIGFALVRLAISDLPYTFTALSPLWGISISISYLCALAFLKPALDRTNNRGFYGALMLLLAIGIQLTAAHHYGHQEARNVIDKRESIRPTVAHFPFDAIEGSTVAAGSGQDCVTILGQNNGTAYLYLPSDRAVVTRTITAEPLTFSSNCRS